MEDDELRHDHEFGFKPDIFLTMLAKIYAF